MTWRHSAWRGRFRWVLIVITIVFGALAIVPWLDSSAPSSARWVVGALLGGSWLLIASLHTWIAVEYGQVRIGFFPFYRRTLRYNDVVGLSVDDIRPFPQYGGLGLKGLSSSTNGLLLGGEPPRGLRVETRDNRRYVLTFPDLDPIISALQKHGCTLRAESSPEM